MKRESFDTRGKMTKYDSAFCPSIVYRVNVKLVKMIINLNIIFSYNYRLSFALFL